MTAMTAPTITLDEWLQMALPLAGRFPDGRLTVAAQDRARAAQLLDAVRAELRGVAEGVAEYFDGSRPRYEYALALALDGGRRGALLDVGCSPGHLAMALSHAGFIVSGIDLNHLWRVKYAPGWADRLKIRCVNLEEEGLPFADRSFDVVMFTEVLEHIAIRDPHAILAECHRVLRTDGRLILSTPNAANVGNIVALLRGENIFWPPSMFYGGLDRHNREYTPAELCDLLARSAFRTYEIGYMNTWGNWHHVTGPLFHHLHDGSARSETLTHHPLFNNTIFAMATRAQ